MSKIVIGVDGSDASRRALEWAIEEAKVRKAEVLAVHAWTFPVVVGTFEAIVPAPPKVDLQEEAEQFLERVVKAVTGGVDSVTVGCHVTQKPAVSALLDASRDADLLVIGSRGLGGFRGLLLGSVGQQCAQHSRCPVVIIPHEERKQG